MPKGTKVHKMKMAIMRDNPELSEKSAIRIAQAKTGLSYKTGKKLKRKFKKR